MLSSITPLGERGRGSRWPVTVTAHLLGSAAGGAALGALLGSVGAVLPLERDGVAAAALAMLVALTGWGVGVETGRLPPLPSWRRQVDEDWLHRYRGWVYGLGYGAQLGVGVVTIVTSPLLYAALVLAVLTGSPGRGALVGLAFGASRALPVLAMRRVTTTRRLGAVHRRLAELAPAGRRAAAVTLGGVAVAAAVHLVLEGALT